MTPYEEVIERQRLDELRDFRRYLVETGAVGCLVELYKHTAQNELRLDNASVVKDFLAAYKDPSPDAVEARILDRENATLREYNATLEQQIADMEADVEAQRRRNIGKKLWARFVSAEYWAAAGGVVLDEAGVTLGQIFQRLCGAVVDEASGVVLVHLVRPFSAEAAEAQVGADAFAEWMATAAPEDVVARGSESLLPRLDASPTVAPYEAEMIQAIRHVAPDASLFQVAIDLVELDAHVRTFMEAAAEYFAAPAGEASPTAGEEEAA